MYRLFSQDEANALLPTVDALLGDLQVRIGSVATLRGTLASLSPASVEARNTAVEIEFLLREIRDLKRDLDRLGVQVTNLEAGTVEIPSKIGGEVVCFVHERGAPEVTHYHRMTDDAELVPVPTLGFEGDERPGRP